jgi:hypothetical protein
LDCGGGHAAFQGALHEYISAMSIAEPMIDATIEPKQPRRLEKNTNIGIRGG